MQVAKVNSNNIVVDVFVVRMDKLIDKSTGTVTEAKTQSVCEAMFGGGFTYVPDSVAKNEPNPEDIWMSTEKVFAIPRPNDINGNACTSWTLQTTADADEITAIGDYKAPHQPGNHPSPLRNFNWKESNQTWYACQVSDEVWYSWDNSAQNWVTTGSTETPS